jgi:P27 family predicted phage terminase small subunit
LEKMRLVRRDRLDAYFLPDLGGLKAMANRKGSGKGGRKPAPVALKLAAGMRSDRIPTNSVEAPAGPVVAPSYLDEFGLEGWNQISAAATRLGLSSPVDADTMAVYAEAYSRWRHACDEARGKTTVLTARGVTTNPAIGVAERAERAMITILSLFGLNPSDRGRLRASEKDAVDPFDQYMREKSS